MEVKLPAVSGSSGRLIVERPKDELSEPDYPGLVFADESLDYSQAMKQFVAASQRKDNQPAQAEIGPAEVEKAGLKAKKQTLRREKEALSLTRRQIREQRKQEDAAWQALKSHAGPTRQSEKLN